MKQGFTFLEVLIALVVSALLIGVACSGVIRSLTAERTAQWVREGGFLVQQAATRQYLEIDQAVTDDWQVVTDKVETGTPPDVERWLVLSASPRERPSLTVKLALERLSTK